MLSICLLCGACALGCSTSTPPAKRTAASPRAASTPGSPSASPSAPTGSPLWTLTAPSDSRVAVTSNGYVLASDHEVFGLGRQGQRRWHHTFHVACDGDDFCEDQIRVQVADSVVIVSRDNPTRQEWPGSLVVLALDARTGATLWRDDQPSFVTALATAVYTSVCHGGQHNRIGDCHLSARDPRTGATRWTVATYASAEVGEPDPLTDALAAPPVPKYLAIYSFPTGATSETVTTVDPASGNGLGTSLRADTFYQTTDHIIAVDRDDNTASRGCKTTLTAWSPYGAGRIWLRTFTGFLDQDQRCSDPSDQIADGQLAVLNGSGHTTLVSLATGKTDWTATEPGTPLLVGNGYVVTTGNDGGLVYYDRSTDRIRWRIGGGAADYQPEWQVQMLGTWLIASDVAYPDCWSDDCPTVNVLDPASGSLYRAPRGVLVSAANGVVVTELDNGNTSGYTAYSIR